MINVSITPEQFEKLTWTPLEVLTTDINDIDIALKGDRVEISLLGQVHIQEMSVEDYNAILSA